MYKFGDKSLANLEGVHPDLVQVVKKAMTMQIMDFSVVEGVRDIERQRNLYHTGRSQTLKSKHLIQPDGYGHAVDLYPYPIDMDKINSGDPREMSRFGILAGIILSCAKQLDIAIISGMDWDGDGQVLDHSFFDAPHFQLQT